MRRKNALRAFNSQEISADAAHLRITDTSRLLQILKDDPKAIFTAAAKASEAVAFLKRLQPPA